MPKKAVITPSTPDREHIFPASRLTPLAIKWKEFSEAGRHKEAMLLLDEIIRGSTAMFERLAQYENLNSSVDLDILVSAAHEKMVRWLQAWNPKAGRLFTWLSKSLSGDTRVLCEDGKYRRIDFIVENKLRINVVSWNEKKAVFEPKPIINWIKSEATKSLWRKLSVKHPTGLKTAFFVTGDHEMYTQRGWIQVDKLVPSDKLHLRVPSITPEGIQALIGMRMGDGTIHRYGSRKQKTIFGVSHGPKQKEYCAYIGKKFNVNCIDWVSTANGKKYPANQISIALSMLWPEAVNLLPEKKGINQWMLDNIGAQAIAYMYMDDGNLYNEITPKLCAHAFNEEDAQLFRKLLFVKFKIDSEWKKRKGRSYGDIIISEHSYSDFFKLVAPYIVPCLSYKIPAQFRVALKEMDFISYEALPCDWTVRAAVGYTNTRRCTSEVVREGERYYKGGFYTPDFKWKYDVTVADNFNFIAEDVIVHNCSKNVFLSEVGKVNQMRRRCYTTSDNLERFYGVEDHEVNRHDLAKEYKRKIRDIHCRWGDPQELGALRYLIDCIVDDAHDKQAAIRSASYCWGISLPMSKFFYNWAVVGLRHQFYEKAYVPFTEYDLLLASESYTLWPEIVDAIGYENSKKLVVLMGGSRVHIPSINVIAKLKEADQMRREIDRSNLDPATIAEIARKRKKTVRSAAEIYREMIAIQHPNRSGEFSVYGDA